MMSDKPVISDAQQSALQKAYDLLGEHFDSVLIAVCWDTEHQSDAVRTLYKGGFLTAIGLAEYSKHTIQFGPSKE